MATIPKIISLDPHTQGDTWPGFEVTNITFNTNPPTYPLASCTLVFKNKKGTVLFKYGTTPAVGEGTITINDADTWAVTVEPTIIDVIPDTYSWDMSFTDTDDTVVTVFSGKLLVNLGIANEYYS